MATRPKYYKTGGNGSYGTLNTKYSLLQSQLAELSGGGGTPQNLADVLATGNDANGLDIQGVDNIALNTINGQAYPPAYTTPTLSAVMTAGNSASTDLNMNSHNITNVVNINGQSYPPPASTNTLAQVLTAGSSANNKIILTDGTTYKTALNELGTGVIQVANVTNGVYSGISAGSVHLTTVGADYFDTTGTTLTLNSSGGISNTLTSSTATITNGAGDTNVMNATSMTITDSGSSGNSTYAYDSISINGTSGTFQADTTQIAIENGGDNVFISNGAGANPVGVRINGSSYIVDANPTSIQQTDPANIVATYIPEIILSGNSNQTVVIPPFTPPHKVILQSAPIPVIDKLQLTSWNFPSGETINTYADTGSYMYLGCESGNIYYFDGSSWLVYATFSGAVKCLYWFAPQGRLYIGGSFNDITNPISQTGLNNICWANSLPTFNSIGVDVFANYSVNGFTGAVFAITGDSSFLYFGGAFQSITGGGLLCNYLACYDWSNTQYIYALDGGYGTGFNANVWGLAITNQYLCVVGEFNTLYTGGGTYPANYCVQLYLNSGFIVGSYYYLLGNPFALNNAISRPDLVKTDGSYYYISTNDSSVGGIQYLLQVPYYSFASVGQVGNNGYNTQQTSFTLNASISSVGYDNRYLQTGNLIATLPFTPYIYWNNQQSRVEFIDIATGSIYAFTGDSNNKFALSSGRNLMNAGNNYTGGWSITPSGASQLGFNSVLFWNGAYYAPLSVNGSGSPYN
jgi:hypothetical protein